jgi:hypothetical protein
MTQKTVTSKKPASQTRDEHELLQQDDFGWLAQIQDVLSPYWSSRMEFYPETKTPVLALEKPRPQDR